MDIGAVIIKQLLDLYNLGTNLLMQALMSYAQQNPRVMTAIQALGSAFNMLVGVTVLYILLKIFSRLEKVILVLIVIGWLVFGLLVAGLMNPSTAQQVASLLEKAVVAINTTG